MMADSPMATILFVEDEENLLNSVTFILEREGFQVTGVSTGEEAMKRALATPPDLVLLDINLPGIDGFEVAQRLRRHPVTTHVLIMLLSARTGIEDVVEGLERYADDYVTKPFHPRVLLARIHALLRRRTTEPSEAPERLCFQNLEIDVAARETRVGEERLALTKTEFDILYLLATHPNHVLSRDQILDAVRGDGAVITERAVDFQVSGLRRKLGSAAALIETVRGVGYKLSP
jgi:two-component system, OmpR family, alkaline phosphatase synthesis response regulator PhoP